MFLLTLYEVPALIFDRRAANLRALEHPEDVKRTSAFVGLIGGRAELIKISDGHLRRLCRCGSVKDHYEHDDETEAFESAHGRTIDVAGRLAKGKIAHMAAEQNQVRYDAEGSLGAWWRGSLEDQEFPCITAFFDESGHSASTRTVAIGGAMTSPKRWGELRVQWKAALQRQGVQVFHMTDFENRQGEFKGWNEAQRRELLTELFAAIADSPITIIGAVAVVEDFNLLDANIRKQIMDPWYLCYQACFHEVLTSGILFVDPKNEGIELEDVRIRACFYELHRQYIRGPILFHMASKAAKEWAGAYQHGIIGFGSKQTTVHFQLADLIAYEIRKHVENAIYKQGRPTRWPMKQLLKGIMMVNIFDNSGTEIPIEGGFAMFRNGSLAEMEKGGPIKFVAQGVSHKG